MKKIAAALCMIFALCLFDSRETSAAEKESAFDRVMRTGTIRCGYMLYDPVLVKDPNSGKIGGVLPDLLEDAAARLDFKIEWTVEDSYVTSFEGLRRGQYDVVCTALWGWPSTGKHGMFVGPAYYYPLGIWVRADDRRFDSDRAKIDDPSVTISGVDGTFPLDAARQNFPKAKTIALPQSADYTAPLMDVLTKKADVTFMDNNIGERFLKANPGSVRNIAADPPYRIYGQFLMVNKGEHELKDMLANVINIQILDGTVDKVLRKHEFAPGRGYYRVAKPYEVPR